MKPKLYRPKIDRVIGGVCAGIAYHLNIDPIFIRVLFAVLIFQPFPIIFVYLLMWAFTPSGE
jgi:phage shock protein PspC (stress-responsive transcriptional regulator)